MGTPREDSIGPARAAVRFAWPRPRRSGSGAPVPVALGSWSTAGRARALGHRPPTGRPRGYGPSPGLVPEGPGLSPTSPARGPPEAHECHQISEEGKPGPIATLSSLPHRRGVRTGKTHLWLQPAVGGEAPRKVQSCASGDMDDMGARALPHHRWHTQSTGAWFISVHAAALITDPHSSRAGPQALRCRGSCPSL